MAGLDPTLSQDLRQSRGTRVQLAAGPDATFTDQCGLVASGRERLVQHPMECRVQRIVALGCVPLLNDDLAACLVEQRQCLQRRVRTVADRPQQSHEVIQPGTDHRRTEQLGSVGTRQRHVAAVVNRVHGQLLEQRLSGHCVITDRKALMSRTRRPKLRPEHHGQLR